MKAGLNIEYWLSESIFKMYINVYEKGSTPGGC